MTWNCRPRPNYGALQRTGYLAGYSDGFHGEHYGAGYDETRPDTYRIGFDEGRADAEPYAPDEDTALRDAWKNA